MFQKIQESHKENGNNTSLEFGNLPYTMVTLEKSQEQSGQQQKHYTEAELLVHEFSMYLTVVWAGYEISIMRIVHVQLSLE